MSKKIFLLGTLLLLFAVSATACQGIPNLLPQPSPTAAPTAAPTPTPEATPQVQSKPQLPDRGKIAGALRLADLAVGIVSENKNGALTLRLAGRQTQQVQTNDKTIVVVPGKTGAQVTDIHVGERVIVDYGDDDKTMATFLLALPADYNMGNVLMAAMVSTKGETINVRTRAGQDKIATDGQTIVVNLSGDKPALGAFKDLRQGNVLIAIGQDGNEAFNAQVIVIADRDARALLNRGRGTSPAPTPTPKPGAG